MTAPVVNTPSYIINDAYFDSGIVQEGDDPSGEQIARGMRKLTDIINFEQTKGLKLWLNVDTAVTLFSGQASYTFKPSGNVDMVKPLRVLEGYWLNTSGNRTPLTVLSWQEYLQLSAANGSTGALSSYFVDKQATLLRVVFWLTPDATAALGTAHVLLQTQVTNFVNLTETMNFPIEWRIFLRWALADELSVGQPQAIMDRCSQRAEMYRQMLEDWDVEDADTQLVPDAQFTSGRGNFV